MATRFNPSTVNPRKEWFKSKAQAVAVYKYRKETLHNYYIDGVFKAPKGTRHSGEYYVGNWQMFINIS